MVPVPLASLMLFLAWLPALIFWSFRKALVWFVVSLLLVAYIQGFTISLPNYAPGDIRPIRVVGSNRGQNDNNPIKAFVERTQADIVAMQEAGEWELADGELDTESWNVEKDSGYVILSRFPIVSKELLSIAESPGLPANAYGFRAVVELPGERLVAVYTVHMPTFRPLIEILRPYSLWSELRLGNFPWREFSSVVSMLGRERESAINALMGKLAKEPLPVILAGDLNSTPGGFPQRSLAGVLNDTFAEQGFGFGWTFPGKSSHLITGYGPVLRIDYIFASEHFSVHQVEVEPDSGAQHRAVMAELALMP
ncbi:endonuclease/exonuclease/phosphatase family protein [Rubellicoccus peritrichatus]|uniref:Endonuclease/exonuclease/phosphatase family protein n=1 Tax=Rubellicoccus peritrichatus TaxID=3080537 RepID=A0AAQ3QTK3_9BACT|nr:endonuclease/exonuclease/phosphatase family protein [Puniceicoccus sp. CR14]WOO41416.1 endonuclease/exonuclease/phosphatase family protein [Puniceicoccus sp. CR14]